MTSSSGEPISVQQLDVVNDVASKSTATSHNAAADDSLSLRLTMTSSSSSSSSSVVLNLRRNEFIDDQTPVYVASHGLIVRWTDFPANQVLTTLRLSWKFITFLRYTVRTHSRRSYFSRTVTPVCLSSHVRYYHFNPQSNVKTITTGPPTVFKRLKESSANVLSAAHCRCAIHRVNTFTIRYSAVSAFCSS